MSGQGQYRPRMHINRVLSASGSRLSARIVLQCLCHNAEFDRPEVTISRPQIAEQTLLCRNSILDALKILKEEGSITPIRNLAGGRGKAVTYRLQPAGQGATAGTNAAKEVGQGGLWDAVSDALRGQLGPEVHASWLAGLQCDGVAAGRLHLTARTQFVAERVSRDFGDMIQGLAALQDDSVTAVTIKAA
ncbi:MAG: hypothetical protein CSA72_08405 [Rhodobacterales bacterium]|nr:MAG: hypothetical protein CSA72_08405 [Rhodobacterales bacterium]